MLDFVNLHPPEGSVSAFVGRHGSIKPAGRVRICNMAVCSAGSGKEKEPRDDRGSRLPIEYPAPEARWRSEYSQRRTPAKRHPVAKRGPRAGCVSSGGAVRLSAFWLDALVANISKLFRPPEKPSLAGVPFLVRG
jgi:hypothetical protein